MTKAEIHKLALLAAAKITLVAGSAGCEREQAGATRQPVAPTVPPGSGPLPGPPAAVPSAAPELTRLMASPAACVAATDNVIQTGVVSPPVTACCNDLLSRAQAGDSVAFGVAFSCCGVPGVKEARSYCSPWGPPAPPAVPAGWLS